MLGKRRGRTKNAISTSAVRRLNLRNGKPRDVDEGSTSRRPSTLLQVVEDMPLIAALSNFALSTSQALQESISDYSIIMNSTLGGLSDAVTEALSTVLPFAGLNETGRVIPASSSRACGAWNQGQHNLFQAAEMSLIIGSLIPHRFQLSTLLARGLFTVGMLLLSLWGGFVVCAWDIVLWFLIHFCINGAYFAFLLWKNIPPPIAAEMKPLYEKSFQPFLVERRLFNKFIKNSQNLVLEEGKRYAVEGITMADERISILISGKMQVTCEGVLLHYVQPTDFIDSPEYESCAAGSEKTSQVTITAVENCSYICWSRDAFANVLRQNEFLDNVVYNLIGKDIAQKLYSLNEFHRLEGSGTLALRKEQADWWRKSIPRSVSMDAVNTEARGRMRSLCWGKDITAESSPPEVAMSDSYGLSFDPMSEPAKAPIARRSTSGRRMSLAGTCLAKLTPKASIVKLNGLKAVTKLLTPQTSRRSTRRVTIQAPI